LLLCCEIVLNNNISGAMLVICDINEYRKCVKDFNIPLVTQLFNTLHALCNLLLVVPENLKQVCNGEELVSGCSLIRFIITASVTMYIFYM